MKWYCRLLLHIQSLPYSLFVASKNVIVASTHGKL